VAPSLLAATLAQTLVPALVGFLGVIVGSALTWVREARKQRGETLAAGRLVGAELADLSEKLKFKLPSDPQDRKAFAAELATPSWDERRSDLALGMKPEKWGDVGQAFAKVAALRVVLEDQSASWIDVNEKTNEALPRIDSAKKALATLEPREWWRALPGRANTVNRLGQTPE
jgi:hypothetical protein